VLYVSTFPWKEEGRSVYLSNTLHLFNNTEKTGASGNIPGTFMLEAESTPKP
jgi:hypothetical protein